MNITFKLDTIQIEEILASLRNELDNKIFEKITYCQDCMWYSLTGKKCNKFNVPMSMSSYCSEAVRVEDRPKLSTGNIAQKY